MSLSVMSGSTHNLLGLVEGPSYPYSRSSAPTTNECGDEISRVIIVSNQLPVRATLETHGGWSFEWDEDALVAQAKDGIDPSLEALFVGGLPVDVDTVDQEAVVSKLRQLRCIPVFLEKELKARFYKGCCKQQLWPLFHYVLPNSPSSPSRFNPEFWQAYKRANQLFAKQILTLFSSKSAYIWIHDYHLLVLPSLLRMRRVNIRCGLFLHSPFPSSEIFRTFPMREDILRSVLSADLVGFHTFDYARHFLSCCSRLFGLEHKTTRGSLGIDYYGRRVGIKTMPTGVNPKRFLTVMGWDDTKKRRSELLSEFEGRKILIGVDDMDTFKGIDLKLRAFQQFLQMHREWREKVVLVQITNPIRQTGPEIQALLKCVQTLIAAINKEFGSDSYKPVVLIDRPLPVYERMAFYSIGDILILTATRDGLNLAPYEYVVCRQGAPSEDDTPKTSMMVVSEFVGCSPSLSGAIRVNPWSIDNVTDGIRTALTMPLDDQQWRHEKHWRYVSQHTIAFWAQSYMTELERIAEHHHTKKYYKLGLGLDTYRVVCMDKSFRKLEPTELLNAYNKSNRRVLLLDYDGTLIPSNSIKPSPPSKILAVLNALCMDNKNLVHLISGRSKKDLCEWFKSVDNLGMAAEHGYFYRGCGVEEWDVTVPVDDFSWKQIAMETVKHYTESTDGSSIEVKDSAIVWHYRDADPDFGNWQAKELQDHLEEILSSEPVEVTSGHFIVEVKPAGISKGQMVERILEEATEQGSPPDLVICVGDDRSDEDMFNVMENGNFSSTQVFACTVGQKPSKAKFYVDDAIDVVALLEKLVSLA